MAKKIPARRIKRLVQSLELARQRGVLMVRVDDVQRWRDNPRLNAAAIPRVVDSMLHFGWTNPLLLRAEDRFLEAGHTRLAALDHIREHAPEEMREALSWAPYVPLEHTEQEAHSYAIADNRLGEFAEWDPTKLPNVLADFGASELAIIGWEPPALEAFLKEHGDLEPDHPGTPDALVARWGAPPFSVLDARQGYWKVRKAAWIALGIKSELGRDGELLTRGHAALDGPGPAAWVGSGTSIFDPVLTELLVRWFSPPGARVLDPFAGGSVRGIVAAMSGREYVGVDLRAEQVEANREQWSQIAARMPPGPPSVDSAIEDAGGMRPCEEIETDAGRIWVKRDDTYSFGAVQGGKVRTCVALARGAKGLVTAGSRQSPQVNIVAHVARRMGIPCKVFTPAGQPSAEVQAAIDAGAQRVEVRPGHNSVIIARARAAAEELGWTEIPFGMECQEAITQTRAQVANIPGGAARLVVPVGSGMTLAGILHGLRDAERALPVLGVMVGADPEKRLDQWAPEGWRDMVTLVRSELDYHEEAPTALGELTLDPVYEAKAIPFLQPDDCLWLVGIRQSIALGRLWYPKTPDAQPEPHVAPTWHTGDSRYIGSIVPDGGYDLILSCPPYADLEQYSDDPADISTLPYNEFVRAYREIIRRTVGQLRDNRFIAWVVGEVRGPDGTYVGLVEETIQAFRGAGARLYNEAVLVTPIGSLPVRAGKTFAASRKLGKGHQNVLVFVKGDPSLAAAYCGEPDLPFDMEETT